MLVMFAFSNYRIHHFALPHLFISAPANWTDFPLIFIGEICPTLFFSINFNYLCHVGCNFGSHNFYARMTLKSLKTQKRKQNCATFYTVSFFLQKILLYSRKKIPILVEKCRKNHKIDHKCYKKRGYGRHLVQCFTDGW